MSSPSVPQFPLFGLPYLGIRNVIDCWNPFELCKFSMISKKAKEIAVTKCKKTAAVIEFDSYRNLEIFCKLNEDQKDQWSFRDVKNSENTYEEVFEDHKVGVYCTDKVSVMLKMFNGLMELFNCTFGEIRFFAYELTDKQFQLIIDWFNVNYQKLLPKIHVASHLSETFKLTFIQNFQGKIEKLSISDKPGTGEVPEPIKVNENLEIEELVAVYTMLLDLSCLLSLNSVEACGGTNLTNEDLKKFLISWQSGKTNSKLRQWCFSIPNKPNWKTVLRGLSPVPKDPRTAKRAYWPRSTNRAHWIHGGVDIQGNDGKILTIANCFGEITNEENEEVSQDAIDQFEKVQSWDWNDDEEEEEVDAGDPEVHPLYEFHFYVLEN